MYGWWGQVIPQPHLVPNDYFNLQSFHLGFWFYLKVTHNSFQLIKMVKKMELKEVGNA